MCSKKPYAERVGLEAGRISEWLVRGLAGHGIEAVLMETDRNDARGLAHLLRMGWFRPVHVKAVSARKQRARISARETLIRQLRDLENSVRGLLRGFGLRVPPLLGARWDDAVRVLIGGGIRACPQSLRRCCRRARHCVSSWPAWTGRFAMPRGKIRSAVA